MVEELKKIVDSKGGWVTEDSDGNDHTLGFYPSGFSVTIRNWMNHGRCHRENGSDWTDKLKTGRFSRYWTLYNEELKGRILLWSN